MGYERIDTMALLPADSPQFTVNAGAGSPYTVPIARPAVPTYNFHLYSSNAQKNFHAGDSFIILTAGLDLPRNYVLSSSPANVYQKCISFAIGLQQTGGGAVYYLPNFGTNGVQIPLVRYDYGLNIFVDVNAVDPVGGYPFRTNNFNVVLYVRGLDEGIPTRPAISMIGVDPLLTGLVENATAYLKILHNEDFV